MTSRLLAPLASPNDPDASNSESQPRHRVVIIDPREERRAITNLYVERCGLLTVVGSAGNLGDAQTQIRTERADVALVEIQMPVTQGLDTIGALRDQFPDLRIVVCSFHNDSATREAARLRGADGYLTKPLQTDDLVVLVESPRSASGADPIEGD
ncbi:MAG: two-component system, NarL family, invasion response regulator UvrY [Acidimicrobiaceae bacterium]